MPRGRHRNPEPLHRLLTPTTVAGVSVASAAAAWLIAEPLPLRLLVALTAAAGVAGAVVMRAWDRSAGRRVAELARERVKDEWKTEERIAELESDLEEARALRAKLDAKLRAKRVELAGLRGEHAALLRRYATAETERASALEGRRLLAIEASAAPAAAPKELPAVSEERTSSGAPTSVGYARAHAAMKALARKAEADPARPKMLEGRGAEPRALEAGSAGGPHSRTDGATGAAAAVPARRPAAAVAPYSAVRRSASRVEGGFDFFGTKTAAQARAVIESVQNEDLADVVGAEALEVHKAESARAAAEPPVKEQGFKPATPEQRAVGQVIDLTAHDETEPIDVVRLRTAIS
ncbi:hypothetical protein [Streptomyces sp. A1547]|uniref:Secreted protein n=1 Tax=Streptomyces sp. R33 TaxID=3238629 RepID=A0AB39Y411_9ACTN|nr:hypothetical protein [Streptomyces sp. A1547]KJY47856.1 hypothetical protein VR46_01125 [Streptomyces sp. NRRL S-444]THA38401.1 hypothetical protein E6W17_15375 [Streptomyces sp. A1547]